MNISFSGKITLQPRTRGSRPHTWQKTSSPPAKKDQSIQFAQMNAERDLLLYSRMPLELRGAPYLASKEKLVRAGFGSYLKKCLTGTGGGCFVNTPATISLYPASICGKVRVVQVTLPLKITI